MDETRKSGPIEELNTTTMRVSVFFQEYVGELRTRFAGILKGNKLSDAQLTDILAKYLQEANIKIKI